MAWLWRGLFVTSTSGTRRIEPLSQHRRLIVVDGPGHGHSDELVRATTLAACGGDGADGPPADAGSSSSPSASDGDTVAVTVTREDDSFTPNGERVELGIGQTLDLTVTSDEAGEAQIEAQPLKLASATADVPIEASCFCRMDTTMGSASGNGCCGREE